MSKFADNLTNAFKQQQHLLGGDAENAVTLMRTQSLETASRLGLPSFRDEHWKYTSVSKLTEQSFRIAAPRVASLDVEAINEISPPFAETRLVFVDGNFSEELSNWSEIQNGVSVALISKLLETDQTAAANALSNESLGQDVFAQINTSFVQDGAIIDIEASIEASPIEVLFVQTGEHQLTCPRLIINAGKNSSVEIIENHISVRAEAKGNGGLTSTVTEISAADGAKIEHYRLQFDDSAHHIGNVRLDADANATISTHSVALGGGITRVDINGSLNESGSHIDMFGLFIARENQHIDHHTRIEHLAPHTTSNENFKGIADDDGRGVFNGKIYVKQDAQKISAIQSSRNLLLSNNAEIDTKPELEIYADDVQCAHGATVGQLSENELFYLRSRGIDYSTARTMLTIAFVGDLVEGIKNETLQTLVESRISKLIRTASER